MEPMLSNFISQPDLSSLENLALIQEDQVIDVYNNGTISVPYSNQTWVASGWRTVRWMGGISNNREDIPKIQGLMQRAMAGYLGGCQEIKFYLESSVAGLEHLKNTYNKQNKTDAYNEINKIISYVQQNLHKKEDLPFHVKRKEKWSHLNELESSTIENAGKVGVRGASDARAYEGVSYYKERIAQFLFLEKENLNQDEINFLQEIDHALENTFESNVSNLKKSDIYNQKVELLTEKLIKEGMKRPDASLQAKNLARVEYVFNKLDKILV